MRSPVGSIRGRQKCPFAQPALTRAKSAQQALQHRSVRDVSEDFPIPRSAQPLAWFEVEDQPST
jgi:hypothetical protein